ncbi:integral membrane protein [Purpureocillium lavendulum]|uniref:Integral membrane protein n=1 Tax=Purpureocillium lavendulum TaxID=1247861 RepID=A0AB34G4W3_9HYPO|nr:integral membrane protein [Purpureocillium lavendulum]
MPADEGLRLFWVQLGLLIPTLVFFGLRVYVRAFITRSFAADDWAIMIATTLFTVTAAVTMGGATTGALGQGDQGVGGRAGVERIVMSMKGIYVCTALYPPISLAIRASVCLFLLRIVTRRLHRQVLQAMLAVVAVASAASLCVDLFQCMPASYYWDRVRGAAHAKGDSGARGRCLSHEAVTAAALAYGTVSALSAWIMGLLPVVMLWNVRMDTRAKVTVIALLGMSVVAGITVIVRMSTLRPLQDSTPTYFKDTAIWAYVEPCVGIIAASVPTLRPLFKRRSSPAAGSSATVRRGVTTVHRSATSQWVELATCPCRGDEETGRAESSGESVETSSRDSDKPVWITTVEKGDGGDDVTARDGITIHTAINVTSYRRA